MNKNFEIFTVKCDNCLQDFDTDSALIFICDDCKSKLHNCPKCGSDDVTFDWQVDPNALGMDRKEGKIYYWSIQCNMCEYEIRLPYDLDEESETAAQIFKQWNEQ